MLASCCLFPHIPGTWLPLLFPFQLSKAQKLHFPRTLAASDSVSKPWSSLFLRILGFSNSAVMLSPWLPLHCGRSRLLFLSQPFTEDFVLGFLSFSSIMNKCMNFKGTSGYKLSPSLWIFNPNYLLDRSIFFMTDYPNSPVKFKLGEALSSLVVNSTTMLITISCRWRLLGGTIPPSLPPVPTSSPSHIHSSSPRALTPAS